MWVPFISLFTSSDDKLQRKRNCSALNVKLLIKVCIYASLCNQVLLGNQASASSSTSSAEPSTSTCHAATLQSLQVLQQLQAVQSTSHGHQVQEIDSHPGLVTGPYSALAANQEAQQVHANQAVEQRPSPSSSVATLTIPVTLNANNMGVVASSSNSQNRHQVAVRSVCSSSTVTAGPSSVVDSTEGGSFAGHHSRGHSSNSLFQVVISIYTRCTIALHSGEIVNTCS